MCAGTGRLVSSDQPPPEPMMTSLALQLTESAAQHPDRPAVRHDDRVLTYGG